MPTYEYACRSCGNHLEVVQSFNDEPLTECPACKERSLRKVFSPIGITFKGSGFYKTDTRSASKSSRGAKADKADSKTGTADDKAGKADAKKSATSDSKSSSSASGSGSGEAKTA